MSAGWGPGEERAQDAGDLSSTFAVVPVKDLLGTKSRLAPLLDPGGRAGLTLYLMKRVIRALLQAGIPPGNLCVVSPDRLVLDSAEEDGAVPLAQRTSGLNPALREAGEWASSRNASSLLVVPADLPLLGPGDVGAMLRAGAETPVAIAPDAGETGTNALLLGPPDAIPFLFGSGSYRAHLEAAKRRGLLVRERRLESLAFDIDTVEDLSNIFDLPIPPDLPEFSRLTGRE